MNPLPLILTLFLGILAGAAAVWPYRRKRGQKGKSPSQWDPDQSLVGGHRPPDLHALAGQLLGFVRQSTDSQGVALLRRSETGWKVAVTSPGLPFTTLNAVPFKEGLIGLAGEGEREVLAETVHSESLGYLAPQPAQVSIALLPVHARGETVGILACHRPAGRPFQESEVAALKRCAKLVIGWEGTAAHVKSLEAARLQEERVSAGIGKMLGQSEPDEISGQLLDSLFDLLPVLYGFVVISSNRNQFYSVVCQKFGAPENFALTKDTWTGWVLLKSAETLYLDGTAGRESAMPILFPGEPFPQDKVALLYPLCNKDERFGIVGLVGSVNDPFGAEGRKYAGEILGPASALLDLSLLHFAHKNLAIRDPLTALFNRRYLDDTLVTELKRAQRQQGSCAYILMDIDHFKRVNDTYGHEVGDIALRIVAERVKDSVREIDIVCRYGGEEFAVILPDCDCQEAARVAERIRQSVSDRAFSPSEDLTLPVTVSLGVSSFPSPAGTITDLSRSVDKALYEAKHKGRNRVVLARR